MSHDTDQSSTAPSHASVFIWVFAISAIWHYTSSSTDIVNYWLRFDPLVTPLVFVSIVTAFVAAVYPNKTPALLIFAGGQLVAIFLRLPFVADHLIMEIFLNLSILLSFGYLAIKQRSLQIRVTEMFELFAPVGRWLLIIMYFFGTFHKINPGFLSLESSCAIPFIHGFPLPAAFLDHSATQYSAIYGTLIFEALAMVLLLSSRTKYLGMLLGMSFHYIIGTSGYGTLAHFSAFALALHTLFAPSGFGRRLYADALIPVALKNASNFKVFTIVLILCQVLFGLHLGITLQVYLVNTLFGLFGACLIFLVWKHAKIRSEDAPYRLKSPMLAANLIPIWMFLHCLSPYVGLGTGGALSMFSGLRTEGGISNHYIITKPLGWFSYQDKVLYVDTATNPSLQAASAAGQGVVMFDFQRHFSHRDKLLLPATFRIDDKVYALTDLDSVSTFAKDNFTTQSWLERKYLLFRLVDSPQPDQCRH